MFSAFTEHNEASQGKLTLEIHCQESHNRLSAEFKKYTCKPYFGLSACIACPDYNKATHHHACSSILVKVATETCMSKSLI